MLPDTPARAGAGGVLMRYIEPAVMICGWLTIAAAGFLFGTCVEAQTRDAGTRSVSVIYSVRIDGETIHAAGLPRTPAPTERLRVRVWWDWYADGGWEALGRLGEEHTVEVLVLQPADPSGAEIWRAWSVTRRWVAADTVQVGDTWQIVLEFEAEREKEVP